jgi:hypothetical protein
MGINESKVKDGKPEKTDIIQLLPICSANEFYLSNNGNDGKDCDSIDNAC